MSTTERYVLTGPHGLDSLRRESVPLPPLGDDDVHVRMRAWSMNYRDLAMPHGGYIANDKVKTDPPLVPLSDGCGEVVDVGDNVRDLAVGDRVASCFFPDWDDGELTREGIASALGGATDGVLARDVVLPSKAWMKVTGEHSFAEAATFPCAAVTAWQALSLGNQAADQTVLLLGTGGVSIFALQLASAMGMRVIQTSSSDAKLERAIGLGATATINYRTTPQWDDEVLKLTDGVGVDHVVEVGGAGTLEKSLRAARVSGRISLIGVLSGMPEQNPSPMSVLFKRLTMQGIYVGSRAMFSDFLAFYERHRLQPVIDERFGFENVRDAYECMQNAGHFGKIVIEDHS